MPTWVIVFVLGRLLIVNVAERVGFIRRPGQLSVRAVDPLASRGGSRVAGLRFLPRGTMKM